MHTHLFLPNHSTLISENNYHYILFQKRQCIRSFSLQLYNFYILWINQLNIKHPRLHEKEWPTQLYTQEQVHIFWNKMKRITAGTCDEWLTHLSFHVLTHYVRQRSWFAHMVINFRNFIIHPFPNHALSYTYLPTLH